jgi:hypothetical protein
MPGQEPEDSGDLLHAGPGAGRQRRLAACRARSRKTAETCCMPALASAEMGHFVSKSREVIQDATDPHNRIVGFGDRHAFDAGLRGKTNLDPSPRRFRNTRLWDATASAAASCGRRCRASEPLPVLTSRDRSRDRLSCTSNLSRCGCAALVGFELVDLPEP